jgi:hypothetical protein
VVEHVNTQQLAGFDDLPRDPIIFRTQSVPTRMFQHYASKEHFLLVAICSEAGEILITHNKQTHREVWQLPGGAIAPGERLKTTCERYVRAEQTSHTLEVIAAEQRASR